MDTQPNFIDVLPDRYHNKANRLFQFIKSKVGGILNWVDNGQIIYRGNIIPYTHISDLIGDAVFERKYATPGMKTFYKALSEMYIPDALLGSQNRRHLTREYRGISDG